MFLLRNERGAIAYSMMLGMLITVGVAAAITVISSSYYGEDGFDFSNPLGGRTQGRVYQGKAIADMKSIGQAIVGHYLRTGKYPEDLEALVADGSVDGMSLNDPWDNSWVYRTDGRSFVLASYGSDGVRGPNPPENWDGTETEPDLIFKDGDWLQVPKNDRTHSIGDGLAQKQRELNERAQRLAAKVDVR